MFTLMIRPCSRSSSTQIGLSCCSVKKTKIELHLSLHVRAGAPVRTRPARPTGEHAVTFHINGKNNQADGPPDTSLWVLRDALGMTGKKFGCGMALRGASTVRIDGQQTRSGVTPRAALADK